MKWLMGISILLVLSSCEKRQLDDCITSKGPERTITRQLDPFERISIRDKFDVVLIQDTTADESVTLTGGENLFTGIDTKVEEGTLFIEDCNTCNFVRTFKERVKLVIRLKKIQALHIISASRIETQGQMVLDELYINHSGLEDASLNVKVAGDVVVESINSGGVILKGSAKKIKGSIEEISTVDARDLICEEALLDSHTRLDCFVNASRLIFVKIYNEGNIWYVKEPTDQKEVNVHKGDGELLKL